MINNQLNIRCVCGIKGFALNLKTPSTDFEFNMPISKKRAPISKDFEKNSIDFERFRKVLERANTLVNHPLKKQSSGQ